MAHVPHEPWRAAAGGPIDPLSYWPPALRVWAAAESSVAKKPAARWPGSSAFLAALLHPAALHLRRSAAHAPPCRLPGRIDCARSASLGRVAPDRALCLTRAPPAWDNPDIQSDIPAGNALTDRPAC